MWQRICLAAMCIFFFIIQWQPICFPSSWNDWREKKKSHLNIFTFNYKRKMPNGNSSGALCHLHAATLLFQQWKCSLHTHTLTTEHRHIRSHIQFYFVAQIWIYLRLHIEMQWWKYMCTQIERPGHGGGSSTMKWIVDAVMSISKCCVTASERRDITHSHIYRWSIKTILGTSEAR